MSIKRLCDKYIVLILKKLFLLTGMGHFSTIVSHFLISFHPTCIFVSLVFNSIQCFPLSVNLKFLQFMHASSSCLSRIWVQLIYIVLRIFGVKYKNCRCRMTISIFII